MNFLPIIALGAIALFATKKKKKSSLKPLPPADDLGTIFSGDTENTPDVIEAKVGEKFTINFKRASGTGYSWLLEASPADDSIRTVKMFNIPSEEHMPGAPSTDYFVFQGIKKGGGSLVFHLQIRLQRGKEPPAEIVEIQVQIS